MTPLRQKMLDIMHFQNLSKKTCQSYLFAVRTLAQYYNRSPELISENEVQSWILNRQKMRNLSPSSVHTLISGLRFFHKEILKESGVFLKDMTLPKRPRKIPYVLLKNEVSKVIQCTANEKYMTLLCLAYSCGLRVSELVKVQLNDINSDSGLLHVTGKGKKDRLVPLSETLLKLLRCYWKKHHPKKYLFPGIRPGTHLSISTVQRSFKKAREQAEITKNISIHGLRHAYATHQLEHGLPIHTLSVYLGHSDTATTMRYLHWVKESPVSCADLLQEIVDELPTFEEAHHHELF
jgi:integrase/recombinase XerD